MSNCLLPSRIGLSAATSLAASLLLLTGCHMQHRSSDPPPVCDVPRELQKTTLPPYVVEPPDILLIESVKLERRTDALIETGDAVVVRVARTVPVDPTDDPVAQYFKQINGVFRVEADGAVDLGPEYGRIVVKGLRIDQARKSIETELRKQLRNPQVLVQWYDSALEQPVRGEHLVRPDGTVSLGAYGSVYVAGLTLDQAKAAVEGQLARSVENPRVSLDVLAYNSKVYYVIADGGGAGESVYRFACTGNETVLDAISQIEGLPVFSSKNRNDIWVARPAPVENGYDQILPVDWNAIAQGGATATNYQILPGDRIYVKADHLVATDTLVAKVTAPIQRILNVVLLGTASVRSIEGQTGNSGVGIVTGF